MILHVKRLTALNLTQPSQTLYEMERRDPILLIRKQVERGEANRPQLHS